jgi:hypothetical protein
MAAEQGRKEQLITVVLMRVFERIQLNDATPYQGCT